MSSTFKPIIITSLLLFTLFTNIFAQKITIKGIVKSASDNEVLIGASIHENGTTNGTISNLEGEFSLEVKANSKITISYVGFKSQIIKVQNNNEIEVSLIDDDRNDEIILFASDEIVDIGYGKVGKRNLSAAVGSIKSDQYNNGNHNSALGLIQGKIAGLHISKLNGGDPTSKEYSIQLRGTGTLLGPEKILYIVDGVPMANINSIHPNDIEAISILKEAAAAAIYGIKAKGGVILLNTKRGQQGIVQIEYNANISTDFIAKNLRVLNAQEYRNMLIPKGKQDEGSNTDWMREITRSMAIRHTHNISITGGTKDFYYRGSVNLSNSDGLAIESSYNELSANFSATQSAFNNKLILRYRLNYNNNKKAWIDSEAFNQALKSNPTRPIFYGQEVSTNVDHPEYYKYINYGGYVEPNGFTNYNPIPIIKGIDDNGHQHVFLGSLSASYFMSNRLRLDTQISLNTNNEWEGKYWHKTTRYQGGAQNDGTAAQSYSNYEKSTIENILSYSNFYRGHRVFTLIGHAYQQENAKGFYAQNSNFITNLYSYNSLQSGMGIKTNSPNAFMGSYKLDEKLVSYFSRIMYDFRSKYFINASLRIDGSSHHATVEEETFGKYGVFYGLNTAWNISQEKFMDDITFISNLNIRAGIGTTGETVKVYDNTNINLLWEKNKEQNIGVDITFGHKFSLILDGYRRYSSNLVWQHNVPSPPNPTPTAWGNEGNIMNSGIELTINSNIVNSNAFNLKGTLNVARNKNKIIRFSPIDSLTQNQTVNLGIIGGGSNPSIYTMRLYEGQPIGNFYGYKLLGIENGKQIFERLDVDGNIVGKTDNPSASRDKQIIGNANPILTGGFSLFAQYKKFEVSTNFYGQFGGKILNAKRYFYENFNTTENVLYSTLNSQMKNLNSFESIQFSDYYLEDASFLRLNDITLRYNYKPKKEFKKYISNIKLSLTVQNAFILTAYKGIDPEMDFGGIVPGIDNLNFYPKQRSYIIGLNMKF